MTADPAPRFTAGRVATVKVNGLASALAGVREGGFAEPRPAVACLFASRRVTTRVWRADGGRHLEPRKADAA